MPWLLCSLKMVASGLLPSPQCQQATSIIHPMLLGTFLTAEDLHPVCGLVHSTGHRWKYKNIIIHKWVNEYIAKNLSLKWKRHNLRKELKISMATKYIMQNCHLFMLLTTDMVVKNYVLVMAWTPNMHLKGVGRKDIYIFLEDTWKAVNWKTEKMRQQNQDSSYGASCKNGR